MAKRLKANVGATGKSAEPGGGELGKVIKDSAHEIWLAGLGAYSRAQQEGVKVFDALVKAGQELQHRTQDTTVGKTAGATAEAVANTTAGAWNKLEHIFEDRVARSLSRLGAPTKADLKALSDKIDELQESVQALLKEQKPVAKKRATGVKTAAKKAPARTRQKKDESGKTEGDGTQ